MSVVLRFGDIAGNISELLTFLSARCEALSHTADSVFSSFSKVFSFVVLLFSAYLPCTGE